MLDLFLNLLIDGITYAFSGGAYLKKAEERRIAELGPMAGLTAERDPVFRQIRYVRRMTRWMAGIGLVLVWIVGAGVKVIMDSLGKPTRPWSDFTGRSPSEFLSMLPELGFYSLLGGAPFLLLAFMGKRYLSERVAAGIDVSAFGRHAKMISCVYVGAVLPAIYLYGVAWWVGDIGLMVLFIPLAIALGAGFGYFAGLTIFDPERDKAGEDTDTPPWCPP